MKKKISLGNKLSLDKQTISKLDEDQLRAIAGGVAANSLSCNGKAESDDDPDIAQEDFNSCCNDSCNKHG